MRRQLTFREQMFKKAWQLNLFADVNSYKDRHSRQEAACNALAYFACIVSDNPPPGPRSMDMAAPRVQTSLGHNLSAAQDRFVDKNKRSEYLTNSVITAQVARAIKSHLVESIDRRLAGRPLNPGRRGEPADNLAFVVAVRMAADLLLREFLREPSDGDFRDGWISADCLGLFAATPKDRKGKDGRSE